jgi:hypothetical protein
MVLDTLPMRIEKRSTGTVNKVSRVFSSFSIATLVAAICIEYVSIIIRVNGNAID